jgi:hypothetical protein
MAKRQKMSHQGKTFSWLVMASAACFLVASMAYAVSSGRLSGTVRDPSGAVIPGADVVLRNTATGTSLKTTTDASGFYAISYIPPGTYTLTVTTKGFKTYVRTGLAVTPGAVEAADATLEVGTSVQTVRVQGSAVNLIPTSTGAETRTIGANEIQNLSTVGRNAMELLTLLPGVVGGTGIPGVAGGFNPSTGSSFDQGVGSFNINGLRNDQNMLRLDNADIIDPGSNGGFIIEPNMDMIQEFSVKQSSFEASQGQSGLIIEAVSKSGGSKIHGEGYWYVRNAVFNANDWSNNSAGLPKPASKFNYPGFNIGGPVRIPGTDFNKNNDKMFFFVGMEWQRQLADPGTELATVPTAMMRQGNFSELLNTKFCQTNSAGQVIGGNYLNMPCLVSDNVGPNPSSPTWNSSPLPGNIIPASDIPDQNGQILLDAFPLPNYVDPNGHYNFAGRPIYPENRSEQTIRIDYNLTENTRAFLRLAHNQEHHYYPYGLWSGENSGWTSNIPEPSPTLGRDSGQSATLNVVSVLNPTLTNEVEFSMSALNLPNHYADPSKLSSSALGFNFKGMPFNGVYTRDNPLPQITDSWSYFGGTPGAGRWGEGDIYNGVYADKTLFELRDNVTKVYGTHTLQFGVTIDRTRNDQNGDGFQSIPEGGFVTQSTWGLTTGNEFGDLLTENVKNYGQATADPEGLWRFWNYEWYAQDSWKATRRLTLNYGARFALMPPWYEARGNTSTFNPLLYNPANSTSILNGIITSSGGTAAANSPLIPASIRGQIVTGLPKGVFPTPGIFIQPRLGFAYDVFGTGRTVIRGGGGIYVTRDQGNIAFFGTDNIPFVFSSASGGNNGFQDFSQITTTNPYGALGNLGLTADNMFDRQDPQTYEWNFTVDQDIGMKTILDVAYVGNVSRHLTNETNINAVPLGAMWEPGTEVVASTNTQPFRYYQPFGNISYVQHTQTANYNSLQVTARRNVSHGLTLLTSYTWSRTLGYATAFNNSIDPFNSRIDYGLLGYDRTHNLNFSYIYQLPNLGAKYFRNNHVAGGVLDNWQISGITNFQSGGPLRVGVSGIGCATAPGATAAATALCSSSAFTGSGVTWYGSDVRNVPPLIEFNPQYGANFTGPNSDWLNPTSVSLPNIGNAGTWEQPTIRGPGSNNWDMTLFKSFSLGEDRRLEFRWAVFDVFNRAQLDYPNTSANFTWLLPANATSLNQGHAVLSNPQQFGYITDKHGHREMEFAIKLFF